MIGSGQGWEKIYITDTSIFKMERYGTSVKQTTDGGFISCGFENPFMNPSSEYVIKTDNQGNKLWDYNPGSNGYFEPHYTINTSDGGYLIAGYGWYNNNFQLFLLKLTNNGSQQWLQHYTAGTSSLGVTSVQETNDGGFILSSGDNLIKTNNIGDSLWYKNVGRGYGNYIQKTNDGGFILCDKDTLIKTDGNGNIQWEQGYSNSSSVYLHEVQQTTDGGYIACGSDYLLKTDGNGIEQWSQSLGSTTFFVNFGFSIKQTSDGGYIITGMTDENYPQMNGFLLKTDNTGVQQWRKTYNYFWWGESRLDEVQITNDGGYIICGTANYISIYLIKTDSQGNVTSTFNIPTPNPNRKLEKVVDLLGRETKQTNQPIFYIYDDGTVEKRITIE